MSMRNHLVRLRRTSLWRVLSPCQFDTKTRPAGTPWIAIWRPCLANKLQYMNAMPPGV